MVPRDPSSSPAPGATTFHAEQRALALGNMWRLRPALDADLGKRERAERAHAEREIRFLERELAAVRAQAAAAPTEPAAFVAWFEGLENAGAGQHDVLFDWLERHASREDMTWFLSQEVAGEAGFDDLVALTQVKMPARAKAELARNYWDEMGQGRARAAHGTILAKLTDHLGIRSIDLDAIVPEALAVGNLLLGLASHRACAYQALGALGVVELTAPGRCVQINRGLKRLGVGGEARSYFALHATLDVAHWESWREEIVKPLAAEGPQVVRALAEGALARLAAGARAYARYRGALDCMSLKACATSRAA